MRQLRFDWLVAEKGALTKPCRVFSGWANVNKLKKFIENRCKPIEDEDGILRFYLSENGVIYYHKERGDKARNIISVLRGFSTTEKMRAEIERMGLHFSYPKPKELIKYIIQVGSEPNDIILDSFAGSGTTGQAVMELSSEGESRKFILIEIDPKTAENITQNRLYKISKGYQSLDGSKVEGTNSSFQFCRLSTEPLFKADGPIRADVSFAQLAEFVWFMETGTGLAQTEQQTKPCTPFLGVYQGRAVFLLYNGILKDKTDKGGNVLNARTLSILREALQQHMPDFEGAWAVYGARTRFDKAQLAAKGLHFHQLPYELAVKTWF